MRINVSNTLDNLASDTRRIPVMAARDMAKTVRRNVTEGRVAMRTIARAASGPHGKAYFKRITSEMLSPLSGEWGPHDGGTPVGGGWRHGVNTDAAKSADLQVPKFANDVQDLPGKWFWPGAD